MRYAIGRVLWIVPVLVVVSLVVFWGLASASRPSIGPVATNGSDEPALPLFFNPQPRDVQRLSTEAMRRVAANEADADESAAQLVRLGGAALPHILPAFDTLAPEERSRVALALAPVARRMQVGTEEELTDPEAAIVFWRRFWDDRAIDFRPVVARRSVERVAQRDSTARRADLIQLDTYALAELFRALGSVHQEHDRDRAARLTSLTSLIARVVEIDRRVHPTDSVDEAARTVRRYKRWWSRHGADFVTHEGPERVYAMVAETEYGKWAIEAVTGGFGVTRSGDTVAEVAWQHAPWTLWLLAMGVVGGYGLGLLIGLVAGARAPGPLDVFLAIGATLIASLPAAWIASLWVPAPKAWGPLVMILVVTALTSRYSRSAVRAKLDAPPAQLLTGFGASRWRVTWSTWDGSSYVLGSLLGVDLPLLFTTAFVVEQALGLPGLSVPTVQAIASHDVAWLMALAITSTLALGLAQIATDALLAFADPRVRAVLSPRREGWE